MTTAASPSQLATEAASVTTSTTGLVVLLGDPVGRSLSPAIHGAAFRTLGLDLVYLACRVQTGTLGEAIAGLDALGALGANVTLPHKRGALDLADSASATAQALGAANTLARSDEGWRADNTDVAGFLAPLRKHRTQLSGQSVVVLGAGGAARAVVYGALTELAAGRVVVAARRVDQAQALADDLSGAGSVEAVPLAEARGAVREATLVVNATPLGMSDGRSPWPDVADLHDGQIVYDLVYRPRPTPFLRAASERGAKTIDGLPMLLGQAAASFRQWTGLDMPLEVARRAALDVLARDP